MGYSLLKIRCLKSGIRDERMPGELTF